jgi:membrane protease YdiL (CAAX protease family)
MPDEMTTENPTGGDAPLQCLACRTPMGQADVCPQCGWSYRPDPDAPPDPDLDPDSPSAPDNEPESALEFPPSPGPPVLSRRAVWAEVGAVLAVSVIPFLFGALSITVYPAPSAPYWLDAVNRTGLVGCTIFVTLYLIYRSGEPWRYFGLTRPRLSDLLLGFALLVVAEALWVFCISRIPTDGAAHADLLPRPRLPGDYLLMVLMYAVVGFAEELVCRAYLITRFEQLLRSRVWAVLLTAALFAAYHAYQGGVGVSYTAAFGVAYGVAFLAMRRIWPLAIGHALYNIRVELAA